jgi:hypothetical protein
VVVNATPRPLYLRVRGPVPIGIRPQDPALPSKSLQRYVNVPYLIRLTFIAFLLSCITYHHRASKRHPPTPPPLPYLETGSATCICNYPIFASRFCFVPAGYALSTPASSGVRRDLVRESKVHGRALRRIEVNEGPRQIAPKVLISFTI